MSTFHRTTESYRQGATTMPGRFYADPEFFGREQAHLRATRWYCVGRAEQLAEPGSYLVQNFGRESVIVLRDKRGTLRAFFNVCRHRGTRLCDAARGKFSQTIQCPYHAWTYATDGRLIGAPHMDEVEGFDKADYPLHPVALAEWEGFLMVNLSRDPEPFAEAFAPLLGRFSRYRLDRLTVGKRIEYDVPANWKLIFQNYSECLHCPTIHPELSSRLPYTSGANDLVEGPFLGGYMVIGDGHQSATMSGRACGLPIAELSDDDMRRAYYYSIFPNLLLSIHPDYAVAYTLWPRDPAFTLVVCEWLFNPDAARRPDFHPDDAIEFWDRTNRQDWNVSRLTQLGVQSASYVPGPYSARESIPAAWDRAFRDALAPVIASSPPPPSGSSPRPGR